MTFFDGMIQPDPSQANDVGVIHPGTRHPEHHQGENWATGDSEKIVAPQSQRGLPAFSVNNAHATPVYQRASLDWRGDVVYVGGGSSAEGAETSTKVIDRQAGRDAVLILNNSSTVTVNIAQSESAVSASMGFPLGPNASIVLPTEGAVYASCAAGSTAQLGIAVFINPDRKD